MAGDVVRSSWVRNMFDERLAKGVGYNFFVTMFLQGSLVSVSMLAAAANGFTATKYVAEFRGIDPAKVGRILGLLQRLTIFTGIAAGLLFALAAPWIAGSVFQAQELTVPLIVGSLGIPFATMSATLMGALAGFEEFRRLARGAFASGCLYVAGCTIGSALFGITGAAWGLTSAAFAQWAIMHLILRRTLRLNGIALARGGYYEERHVLLLFTLPTAIACFYMIPMNWLAGVLLARTADGFTQFALYSAAFNAKTIVLVVPNVINGVGLALLNNHRRHSSSGYKSAFVNNLILVWTSTVVAAALFACFGTIFLSAYGRAFEDGYSTLLVLMGATVFEGLALAVYQHIVVRAKMWLSFLAIVVPRDTILVGLAYVLTPAYGALGLAEAYFIASVVGFTSTALSFLLLAKENRKQVSAS
jgi:O-antigen/teichoic acid export membrane protein